MGPLPIDQLLFKATHNSYDRGRPPEQQIDDFGVWAIELDVSVPIENGPSRLIVGHDRAGKALGDNDLSGGDPQAKTREDRFRLEYYLTRLKNTLAKRYRPIFIFFEKKAWINWFPSPGQPPRFDNVDYDDPARFLGLLENELAVFEDKIFGPSALEAYQAKHAGQYPPVPELAGLIIPVLIQYFNGGDAFIGGTNMVFHDGPCPAPIDGWGARCRGFNLRAGINDDDDCGKPNDLESYNMYRLNNYQEDWTFEHVVPPNPLVVDFNGRSVTRVSGCDSDVDVHEQGTCVFPYRTVAKAVARSEGRALSQPADLRRAGYGWTLLIRPGNYREALTINVPLTLEKDPRLPGTVVIGR